MEENGHATKANRGRRPLAIAVVAVVVVVIVATVFALGLFDREGVDWERATDSYPDELWDTEPPQIPELYPPSWTDEEPVTPGGEPEVPDGDSPSDPDVPTDPWQPDLPEGYMDFMDSLRDYQYYGLLHSGVVKVYVEGYDVYDNVTGRFDYDRTYTITPEERGYDNYFDLLSDIAYEDPSRAEHVFSLISDGIDRMIERYSSDVGGQPHGYFRNTAVYSNRNVADYLPGNMWIMRSDVVYSNIENAADYLLSYEKDKLNEDLWQRGLLWCEAMCGPQQNIVLELTVHDYLPEDVQEWRVMYWGYTSENDYKNELILQWQRLEVIRELLETVPTRNNGMTGWMFDSENITDYEDNMIDLIMQYNGILATLSDVENESDMKAFMEAYPPVVTCFTDMMKLYMMTYLKSGEVLEDCYTDERAQEIRDLVDSIEAQLAWLMSKDALRYVDPYLKQICEWDEMYYMDYYTWTVDDMRLFFNYMKDMPYIDSMLNGTGVIVDIRPL